jgi:hypothetical protein
VLPDRCNVFYKNFVHILNAKKRGKKENNYSLKKEYFYYTTAYAVVPTGRFAASQQNAIPVGKL